MSLPRALLLTALALAACGRPEPRTTRFHVEGMVCDSCEEGICHRVKKIPGVLECSADYTTLSTEVRHDPAQAPADAIAAAITELGYTATPAP